MAALPRTHPSGPAALTPFPAGLGPAPATRPLERCKPVPALTSSHARNAGSTDGARKFPGVKAAPPSSPLIHAASDIDAVAADSAASKALEPDEAGVGALSEAHSAESARRALSPASAMTASCTDCASACVKLRGLGAAATYRARADEIAANRAGGVNTMGRFCWRGDFEVVRGALGLRGSRGSRGSRGLRGSLDSLAGRPRVAGVTAAALWRPRDRPRDQAGSSAAGPRDQAGGSAAGALVDTTAPAVLPELGFALTRLCPAASLVSSGPLAFASTWASSASIDDSAVRRDSSAPLLACFGPAGRRGPRHKHDARLSMHRNDAALQLRQ